MTKMRIIKGLFWDVTGCLNICMKYISFPKHCTAVYMSKKHDICIVHLFQTSCTGRIIADNLSLDFCCNFYPNKYYRTMRFRYKIQPQLCSSVNGIKFISDYKSGFHAERPFGDISLCKMHTSSLFTITSELNFLTH
jgi:hypothetical protein